MSKTRLLLISVATVLSVIVLASQLALPNLLSSHLRALQEAQSASGTLNVQPLAGTPYSIKFKYAKPNLFRFESETGYTVSDGKNVYSYLKASNSYTVQTADEAGVIGKTATTDLWAWAPFFNKDAYKDAQAKVGAKRTVKGSKVTEVNVSWLKPEAGDATIYFDDSNGSVKGFNIKSGDKEYVIFTEELVVSKDPADVAAFAFTAPADAKKVETLDTAKTGFAGVQAIFNRSCMPCHNAQNHKNGINLTSYDAIVGSGEAVVAGAPERSGVYTQTKGPRPSMPQMRAPLSEADVKIIYDWIKDGAKDE